MNPDTLSRASVVTYPPPLPLAPKMSGYPFSSSTTYDNGDEVEGGYAYNAKRNGLGARTQKTKMRDQLANYSSQWNQKARDKLRKLEKYTGWNLSGSEDDDVTAMSNHFTFPGSKRYRAVEVSQFIFYAAAFVASLTVVAAGTGQQFQNIRLSYNGDLQFARTWRAAALIPGYLGVEAFAHFCQIFSVWHDSQIKHAFPMSVWFSFSISVAIISALVGAVVGINDVIEIVLMGVCTMIGVVVMALSEKRPGASLSLVETMLRRDKSEGEERERLEKLVEFEQNDMWWSKLRNFLVGAAVSLLPQILTLVVFSKHTGSGNTAIQASVIGLFTLMCLHHLVRGFMLFIRASPRAIYLTNCFLKFAIIVFFTVSLHAGSYQNYNDVVNV